MRINRQALNFVIYFALSIGVFCSPLPKALACSTLESDFRQPNGIAVVKMRIDRAVKHKIIQLDEQQLERLDIALWLFRQRLEAVASAQDGVYYLFDIYGSHFTYLAIDGGQLDIGEHRFPPLGHPGVVIADVRVLLALVEGQLSFPEVEEMGLMPIDIQDSVLHSLLSQAFPGH
ncbi:hypothetical protein [Vibrio sp. WXL210]|uniref:hypothetical protein n=1 Tax=Vibrio sp. WXL210 TaxID=3450709 RepID=UPI003EC7B430